MKERKRPPGPKPGETAVIFGTDPKAAPLPVPQAESEAA